MTKDLFILTNEQQRVLKKFKWDVTPQGKVLDL